MAVNIIRKDKIVLESFYNHPYLKMKIDDADDAGTVSYAWSTCNGNCEKMAIVKHSQKIKKVTKDKEIYISMSKVTNVTTVGTSNGKTVVTFRNESGIEDVGFLISTKLVECYTLNSSGRYDFSVIDAEGMTKEEAIIKANEFVRP